MESGLDKHRGALGARIGDAHVRGLIEVVDNQLNSGDPLRMCPRFSA